VSHHEVVELDRREQGRNSPADGGDIVPEAAQLVCRDVVQLGDVAFEDQHRVAGVGLMAVQARLATGQLAEQVTVFVAGQMTVSAHRTIHT
jgi:hypothetical protein